MKLKQWGRYLSTQNGLVVLLICMVWGTPLTNLIVAVLNRTPMLNQISSLIMVLIYVLVILLAIKRLSRYFSGWDIIFFIGCILIFIFHVILYPQNNAMFEEYWFLFAFSALPCFFIGIVLDNDTLFKIVNVISVICIFFSGFTYLFLMQRTLGSMEENAVKEIMSASYGLLPYLLFSIFGLFKKFTIWGLVASVLGVFLLLSLGTRGPVLCWLFFVALCVVFLLKREKRFSFTTAILLLGVVIIGMNTEVIAQFMQESTAAVGMSSRIFDSYLNEEFMEQSGRDYIAQNVWQTSLYGDFWGYGLGGTWNMYGKGYSHNLFLDFVSSFGVVPGIILFAILIIVLFIGFFHCNSNESRGLFFVLFICGFVSLFFSQYFLGNKWFFMLIGYCVGRIRSVHLPRIFLIHT